MMRIFHIIKKNFQITLSSKVSLVLFLVGPIVLMFIVGAGLSDSGLREIKASVYSESSGEFVNNFIEAMKLRSFLPLTKDSLQECISSVRIGESSVCIELEKNEVNIPPGIRVSKKDIEEVGVGYSVKVHADFSKPRVVWGIIAKVEGVTSLFSDKVRKFSENKFKQKSREFSNKISEESKKIGLSKTYARFAKSKLEEIRALVPENADASVVYGGLSFIKSEIQAIKSYLPENQSLFLNLEDGIKNLEEAISGSIIQDSQDFFSLIDEGQNRMDNIYSELNSIEASFDSLNRESADFSRLSWDYIAHPIPMTYRELSGEKVESSKKKLDFFDYLFPSFIAFFTLLVSLFFSTTATIKEKNSKSVIRNRLSKASPAEFIISNYISLLIVIIVQVLIIIAISKFFLNLNLIGNISNILLIVALSSSVFIFLGMIVATVISSSEMAIITSISISIVLIIFSSLIAPIETLPTFLKSIISNSPLVLTESLLRKYLVFETSIFKGAKQLSYMSLYLLFLASLSWASALFQRKKEAG